MVPARIPLALGVVAFAIAIAVRPHLRNWGATDDDRRMALPGDGLIPGERGTSTMAIDIAATPEAVWPWLAQMGNDRAGWYSWDHLDNGGRPSAQELHPEWARIEEGDRLVTVPDRSWFDVARVEPGRSLVLRASLDLLGRPFDPGGRHPRWYSDSRWELFLQPRPDGTTRLLARTGGVGVPFVLTNLMNLVFGHPAHLVMQTRQLRQLRRRVERG